MTVLVGRQESVHGPDGVEIGLVTAGSGPPLLLVHGGMTRRTRWAPIWAGLTACHRVTAMDRRGRGASGDTAAYALDREFDDVHAVADHLAASAPEGIDVFGHSIGAVCALGAAARGAPIRRLALYEPPGPQTVTRDWIDRVSDWISSGRPDRAMGSFLVEIVGLDGQTVISLRDSPAAEDAVPIVENTMVREAEALLAVDVVGLTAGVTVPVLLMVGDRSPGWAATVTSRLRQDLPGVTLTVLDGHGHEAVDTAPGLVVARLDRFFAGTERVGPRGST
ncbi:MAG: alpha/beta hydrolase [Pseudonocardia sp.]|nr:alpha/beta hydrolase [Pseudonocardia sp.]